MQSKARIAGWSYSSLGTKLGQTPSTLVKQALASALHRAGMQHKQLDGFLSCPSLADQRFMWAHHLASECGVLPSSSHRGVHVATIDNGGASPVSMLLQARALIESRQCSAVAVVAGDAVSSLPPTQFLERANGSMHTPSDVRDTNGHAVEMADLAEPIIPHGYAHCARAHMQVHGLTREQLAMVAVLMSAQASYHPFALQRTPYDLNDVLSAPPVAPYTGLYECARKSDGAAALIVTSASFSFAPIQVLGGGEAAGPMGLAKKNSALLSSISSAAAAFEIAYKDAGVSEQHIDYFGLYDCFPICFIRALEAARLAPVVRKKTVYTLKRAVYTVKKESSIRLKESLIYVQKSPIFSRKGPLIYAKKPYMRLKSRIYAQKSRIYAQKRVLYAFENPLYSRKRPLYTLKGALCTFQNALFYWVKTCCIIDFKRAYLSGQ